MGHYLAGEQLGVFAGQFRGHTADLEQYHQVADAEQFAGFGQLLAHGFGAAADDMTLPDVVGPLVFGGGALGFLAHLGAQGFADGIQGAVAGRFGEGRIDAQHLFVEVLDVLLVVFFGLLVGFGDADQLEEAQPVGVVVDAALGGAFPVALDDVVAAQVAVVGEVAVHIVAVQHPVPGFQAAGTGDPHRRVGLLHGARPDADVAQLVVLAVENGGLALRPRLHHHIVGFGVALAEGDGHLAVGEGGIH